MGAKIAMNISTSVKTSRRFRWLRFSLRTFLGFVLVASLLSSWISIKLQRAREQTFAVGIILDRGGEVKYDYPKGNFAAKATPAWLRRQLGDDFFRNVVDVTLRHCHVSAGDLKFLGQLRKVKRLDLAYASVSDTGLEYLRNLTKLRELLISTSYGAKITDSGLPHLSRMSNLEKLELRHTDVTDAGLVHLKGMENLRELCLAGTKVSDTGMTHFEGMSNLEKLILSSTEVTKARARELDRQLPKCEVINVNGR